MMNKTLKGFEDFFPKEKIRRQKILEIIKNSFEKYGFSPLETPTLESWETLSAKGVGGPEILKETYHFEDKGERKIGLRYDLTVPLSRFISNNPQIPLPFKRYQIGRVWRYGDVSKGRKREFWQADVDIIGVRDMIADAECVACAVDAIEQLGFSKFKVRINNRKLLNAMIRYSGVAKDKVIEALRSIDKLDKIGIKGVKKELIEREISKEASNKLLKIINIKGEPKKTLKKSKKLIGDSKEGKKGIEELKSLINYLDIFNISKYEIDFSLARGLDYYTGPIFEIFAEEGIGSIAGGGRYDNLIGLLSGEKYPATGISLGIERISEVIKERKIIKTPKTRTQIFIANVNKKVFNKALEIAVKLRKNGINIEVNLRNRSLGKQLNYVNSQEIPYVIIVGEKDLKGNKLTLKNMESGEESRLDLSNLSKKIKKIIY